MLHTFFVHFFAVVLHDYNEKLLVHVLWRKCCMRSCSLFFFFAVTHFHLAGRLHFSFCQRCYKIFMLFFQQNWSTLFFISRSSSFSDIRVNVDIKIKSKEIIVFVVVVVVVVVVFIYKSSGGYAIYRRNARVLEMQNFTPLT